jgi:hypothetical protein
MLITLTRFAAACACALAFAAPAAAQTTAGEVFTLETDARYHASFGDQWYGSVCAGPGEYFAVWTDLRVGGLAASGYDLYGARMRPDGTSPTPGSLELVRDMGRLITGIPAVAWNGSVYLVAWHEGTTLYGMRVDAEGAPLDPGGFVIDQRTSVGLAWPAIASDGQDFLVVQSGRDGAVYASRVSGGGVVLDPAPMVLDSGATSVGYPKVAFAEGMYVVVWSRLPSAHVRASRITSAGQQLDPAGGRAVSAGTFDVDPHIDYDGARFYIVWQRQDGALWDLYGAHATAEGPVISPERLLLDGNSWGYVSSGQVAWNGSQHLVTITTNEPIFSNTDLYALRVSADGFAIAEPFPVCIQEGRSQVAMGVAAIGDQWLISWEANYILGVHYVYNTEGARIDETGTVLDRPTPLSISGSAAWQIASATAFDGTNFLSVFEDWREGPPIYTSDLYAVRTTPQGEPLDAAAIRVGAVAGTDQQQPDVTFGAGQYAIVYESSAGAVSEVRMVRMLPGGTPLDPPAGILIFANEPTAETFRPKVAFNGEHYCVVWYDNYLFAGQAPLQYRLVRPDGTLVGAGPVNVPGSSFAGLDGFDVTAGPSGDFLIAWAGDESIRAVRVSPSGAPGAMRVVQSTGSWIIEATRPAWNGQNYLVTWTQWGGGVTVYARLLDASGVPIGATFTVTGPHEHAHSADAFAQGADFLIVGGRTVSGQVESFLARVRSDGTTPEPPALLQSLDRDETYSGSSYALGDGRLMATHALWTSNPYNAPRAHGQLFELNACDADCDGSGSLDFFDFLCFQNQFAAGDPAADCDESGSLDFFDVLCFQNAFAAGCP